MSANRTTIALNREENLTQNLTCSLRSLFSDSLLACRYKISRHEKARLMRALVFGGGGGSRTPVRKHSAVGTTCLVSSLALATQCRTSTIESSEHIIYLTIRCKCDPSGDPASVAPVQTHRQIRKRGRSYYKTKLKV